MTPLLRRRRKVYLDDLPRTHDLRFAVTFLLGLAAVLAGLYGLGYLIAGDRLPDGTTVAGVDVGGMPPNRARTVLQEELAPRLSTPIEAIAAGRRYRLDPQAAGLTFDVDATVDEALGGSAWDPRHMLQVLTGGGEVEPVIVRNDAELAAELARIGRDVRRDPVDAGVSFPAGQPRIAFGEAGRRLDVRRSGDRLEAALGRGESRVRLVVRVVQPTITGLEATRFVDKVARPALAGPVRLRAGRTTLTLDPVTFGRALRAIPDAGGLRLDVDPSTLLRRATPALSRLPNRPVDASLRFSGSRVRVVPGASGQTVAAADLAAALLRAVAPPDPTRAARARLVSSPPSLTTGELRRLRIREMVGQATLRYDRAAAVRPLARAVGRLDGRVLRPGETLSFSRTVGAVRERSVGSLLASATHLAGYRAGLAVPSRAPNDVYDPDLPLGLDASVDASGVDLRLQNTTPYGVYVRAHLERASRGTGSVFVQMWSSPTWTVRIRISPRYAVVAPGVLVSRSPSCRAGSGSPGFSVDVTRVLRRPGERRTDRIVTRYAPSDRVICR